MAEAVRAQSFGSVADDYDEARLLARLSHPDLAVIRRGLSKDGKALRAETAVDDVRDGLGIFRTTSGTGGWRIAIVDSAVTPAMVKISSRSERSRSSVS